MPQWQSICLACRRPQVQSPAPPTERLSLCSTFNCCKLLQPMAPGALRRHKSCSPVSAPPECLCYNLCSHHFNTTLFCLASIFTCALQHTLTQRGKRSTQQTHELFCSPECKPPHPQQPNIKLLAPDRVSFASLHVFCKKSTRP